MSYHALINSLVPRNNTPLTALDLFAGCGGLSLGLEAFGFRTIGVEMNSDASTTYRNNLRGDCKTACLTMSYDFPQADILIGGPACQPFSVGGNQLGSKDERNGFPIFLEAIRQLNPRAVLIENVRGLLNSHRRYLDQVVEALENLGYFVEFQLMNAVNYKVPQNRQRVIIVAHRSSFIFPKPFKNRYTVHDAIGDTVYHVCDETKILTQSMDEYIAKYERASCCVTPRDLHTDRSARTLTCKNLAGATGDMHRVLLRDGRRRRLTVREAARLQSFPDWFVFAGSESSQFNQIGNAVPPLLAHYLAKEIYRTVNREQKTANEVLDLHYHKRLKQFISGQASNSSVELVCQ